MSCESSNTRSSQDDDRLPDHAVEPHLQAAAVQHLHLSPHILSFSPNDATAELTHLGLLIISALNARAFHHPVFQHIAPNFRSRHDNTVFLDADASLTDVRSREAYIRTHKEMVRRHPRLRWDVMRAVVELHPHGSDDKDERADVWLFMRVSGLSGKGHGREIGMESVSVQRWTRSIPKGDRLGSKKQQAKADDGGVWWCVGHDGFRSAGGVTSSGSDVH